MNEELHEALLLIVDCARETAEEERARVEKFEDDELIPSWLPELENALEEYDKINT